MTHGLHIRRALAGDLDDVLELTRDVWEGTDYVPYVLSNWLADARGYLHVALLDNRLVGLQHVDLQPDGTAWLEGIRVSTAVRTQGIGRVLLDHGVAWARNLGSPAVRLASYSGNEASNRMAERAGLQLIRTFGLWSVPVAESGSGAPVRLAGPWESDDIMRFISSHLDSTGGTIFYTEGWTAYSLTPQRLAALLSQHAVAVTGIGSITGVAIATATVQRPALRPGLLTGTPQAAGVLAAWLRDRATVGGATAVRGPLAVPDGLTDVLEREGFSRREDATMNLWELRLR
ncbi:MAG: GNAT family N-acetyltransferase [Chloroflexota bacterium]|nr:GNAT family N-acetyltransferase [Chloroflexota bacterium]